MTPAEVEAQLARLHAEVERLAALIEVPERLRLGSQEPIGDGLWMNLYWREGDDGDDPDGYYLSLISRESGQDWEIEEVLLEFSDELLFQFFSFVTHQVAVQALGDNSEACFHRRLFATQEGLMTRLKLIWGERTARRHEQILALSPNNDDTT